MISALDTKTKLREAVIITLDANNKEHAIKNLLAYSYIHFNKHDGYIDHQVSSIISEY